MRRNLFKTKLNWVRFEKTRTLPCPVDAQPFVKQPNSPKSEGHTLFVQTTQPHLQVPVI